MTEDTRNADAIGPAASRGAANTRTGGGGRRPAAPDLSRPEEAQALTGAAALRLHALLARRLSGKRWEGAETWEATMSEVLAALETPRLRGVFLLLYAAADVTHRVYGMPWEHLQNILDGKETDDQQRQAARRIARAMRLLKRLLRAGCERRGEYVSASHRLGEKTGGR